MNTPSAISHDLIRVTQAQTVRATRYTWHSATSQRQPGRWVADWFRRHLPTTPRRRPRLVPTDTAATRRHGSCAGIGHHRRTAPPDRRSGDVGRAVRSVSRSSNQIAAAPSVS
jgi:hypothetical protein